MTAGADDDPDLVALRAINARLEVLYGQRIDAEGRPDGALDIAIDALEQEAATLIRARTERTLAPIRARHDAALIVAHRLLGRPRPEGVSMSDAEADAIVAAGARAGAPTEGCPAVGVGGFHSSGYSDPDDGVCLWCGDDTSRRDSSPPDGV